MIINYFGGGFLFVSKILKSSTIQIQRIAQSTNPAQSDQAFFIIVYLYLETVIVQNKKYVLWLWRSGPDSRI